jgi:cellulose synthase operon protein C
MRVFNVRLAAILLGIAMALGIGVYLLNTYQVRSNASFFLDQSKIAEQRAAEAAKEKNPAKEAKAMKDAINYLNWYVGLMPKKYEEMEHLGILLADKAQKSELIDRQSFFMAYGTLEKTVRLDPERTVARKRLVTMAMLPQVRRYQDAKDHLERYLLVDSPKDPDLLEQLAECQMGLRMFDQARDSLQKVIASNPAQASAYAKLAELLRHRLAKPQEADQLMTKLVRVNPKSSKAHYLRAAYLADPKLKRSDEALEEACKAKLLAPDDVDVLLLTAECNMAKRKFDNARDCLAQGIKLQPSNYLLYADLFHVELSAGNRDKALAALQEGIKATDRYPTLLWLMANILIDDNKLDEARQIVDELRKKLFNKPMIDYVDARIEFVRQHWKSAIERLNNARGSMVLEPRYIRYVLQLDFWLSLCHRALGDREQQEQDLRRALAIDPSFAPAKKALAEISRQKGNIADTLKEFMELYRDGRLDSAGKLQLAQLLFVNIARQDEKRRNWKPLEKLLDSLDKALPDSPDLPVLRANVLEATKRTAEAEKLLLKARDKYPKQIAPWKGLVALAVRGKDWEKADSLLAEAEKALGDVVELRLLRGQYAVLRGGVGVANRLQELAENTAQFSDRDRVQLWSGLLDDARLIDDKKLAGLLAQKIMEKEPNNAEIRKIRFEQAIATEDLDAAKQALKAIEVVTGQDDAYSLYGHAVLLCMEANNAKNAGPLLDGALGYLKKARDARKDWARVPMLEGSIYDQQGKSDLALQSFLDGIELGDRNPVGIQRAVDILVRAQRYADADQLLHRLAGERGSLPTTLMKTAALCAMYLKDTPRALAETRKAVPADSKNGRDQVWLGGMLGIFGREAKEKGRSTDAAELLGDAEKALRRGTQLEPKLPITWKAMVQFFALLDEQYKAETAIQEAKANVPAAELPQLLAECYELIGNFDAAQEQYEAMLKAEPQNIGIVRRVIDFYRRAGKRGPAQALLQGILDGKLQAGELEVAWARRELAKFLVGSDKYPDLLRAEKLVEQNLASPQGSIADRQLLARLLASDPDPRPEARRKAIDTFESLGASATPDDRFALARLYARAGNWIKAGDMLRGLVASNNQDPRFLQFYIDELVKHNEMSSAQSYFGYLDKLAPNSFGTISRKADLLLAANPPQPLQAINVLKDYVNNVDAETRDRGLRLRAVAEKLAELAGRMKKPEQAAFAAQAIALAESLFRTFNKENPGNDLVLAVFLGRHGKIDEALAILDESLQIGNLETFAQACSFIIEEGKPSKAQLQRMSKIMQSAEAKYERVPRLLMIMADLRVKQALYSEAIDIYREVLKKEPNHYFALNNLAVLQALQGVKLDESLASVNRAMEHAGPLGAILDSRGTVYIAMKNPEKAVADMKAAADDKDSPDRLFHLAQAFELAGDNIEAKKAFDKALKKGLSKESLQPLEVPALERLRQRLR